MRFWILILSIALITTMGVLFNTQAQVAWLEKSQANTRAWLDRHELDLYKLNYDMNSHRKLIFEGQAQGRRLSGRAECLRDTMDVMIGVWPGRASAPKMCGDWPEWKDFGENTFFHRKLQ